MEQVPNKYLTLRTLISTILLGTGAILYFRYGSKDEAFFLLLIITLIFLHSLLTYLLYPLIKKYHRSLRIFLIASDLVFASAVIALTGGVSSPFVFLYALIIIVTGILFAHYASYVTAAASWVMYLLIVIYQFNVEFSSSTDIYTTELLFEEKRFAYTILNLVGFLLIGMLSGYLSERIQETRKKLIESVKSLQILKNLHENILQSISSGVITLDMDGNVISINRRALEILELKNDVDMLNQPLNPLFSNDLVEQLIMIKRMEIDYSLYDNKTLVLGLSGSELKDHEGQIQGRIIAFQDLTELKILEDRLRKSEKLVMFGQLAAGLAHEIRNPISAISGAIEMIQEVVSSSDINTRLLNVASKEIDKLNYLVEDFLILTSSDTEPDGPININELLSDTIISFVSTVRKSSLTINTNLYDDNLYIRANSNRFKQVIWNLLQNAMHSMPAGGIINVETDDGDDHIVLRVIDEGEGIDDDIKDKIFEPFFTTKEVGTGLGLAIARKVIDSYNGNIEVVDLDGLGTMFVINIPKYKQEEMYKLQDTN